MSGFWSLSLIRLFDFYLALLFIATVLRRVDLYRSVVGLVVRVPGRWPRLLKVLRQHRMVLFAWPLMAPLILALALLATQLLASRLVWPEAGRPPHGLTVGDFAHCWLALGFAVPLGVAMVVLDVWGLIRVGQVDQGLLAKHFDMAEYWLRSRTAHVVKIFTLGFVNPRKIVSNEVEKALIEVRKMLATNFWWMAVVLGIRIAFGLTLWLTWAFTLARG